MTSILEPPGLAWHRRAGELTEWVVRYLLNRCDCYGSYYRHEDGTVDQVTRKCPGGLPHTVLTRHFQAAKTRHVVGLHTTSWLPSGCVSRWAATDVDYHHDQAGLPE